MEFDAIGIPYTFIRLTAISIVDEKEVRYEYIIFKGGRVLALLWDPEERKVLVTTKGNKRTSRANELLKEFSQRLERYGKLVDNGLLMVRNVGVPKHVKNKFYFLVAEYEAKKNN